MITIKFFYLESLFTQWWDIQVLWTVQLIDRATIERKRLYWKAAIIDQWKLGAIWKYFGEKKHLTITMSVHRIKKWPRPRYVFYTAGLCWKFYFVCALAVIDSKLPLFPQRFLLLETRWVYYQNVANISGDINESDLIAIYNLTPIVLADSPVPWYDIFTYFLGVCACLFWCSN